MARTPHALTMTLLLAGSALAADADLEKRYAQSVKPFLTRYCAGCHSGASPAAGLDLKAYDNAADVIKDFPRWTAVSDRLTAKTMPPKPASQPADGARQNVIDWILALRTAEARKSAGDPGPVLARRLSNAEYDYTIRDLTGVDIRPAKEFPVDPANTEGFDNSGESLAMSPTLLTKYLQAARNVADHMNLTPDGFDFAPHPMLAETDRDRYTIGRIIDFYRSQPTDFADYFQAAWRYKHRAALGKPRATLADIAAESKLSAKYLPMVWQILEEPTEKGKPEVGPVAKVQAMWKTLPAPGGDMKALRQQSETMRDWVAKIRLNTAMQFSCPQVAGLPQGSQPLLNWKLQQYNLNRRKADLSVLRSEGEPEPVPPPVPRYPGLHRDAAPRWAVLMALGRYGNPDLVVPKGADRARHEASFSRLASVFPDMFYVSDRGRYWPDDSQDRGRFLSAGIHNAMGYWRDDTALMELILDEKGRQQLDRLWLEFDYIARQTERTYDQFYFNQAGAVDGKGAESGRPRPLDKAITDPAVILGMMKDYLAKSLADPDNHPDAYEAIRVHFRRVNDTLRLMEKLKLEAEPKQLDTLLRFAARAYRRPLTGPEREEFMTFYKSIRERNGLTHEDAMRDMIVRVLMSPKFCYRVDLTDAQPARAVAARR